MDPRYPIGKFERPGKLTAEDRAHLIQQIEMLPFQVHRVVNHLTDKQLDTPYREGGWTIRQVIHHLPESHMNAYLRVKLALTEESPTIKPYDEAAWGRLPDATTAPIDLSLALLSALHARWVVVLRQIREEDFQRTFVHPEWEHPMTIETLVALYAWHGRHHLAQINSAL